MTETEFHPATPRDIIDIIDRVERKIGGIRTRYEGKLFEMPEQDWFLVRDYLERLQSPARRIEELERELAELKGAANWDEFQNRLKPL